MTQQSGTGKLVPALHWPRLECDSACLTVAGRSLKKPLSLFFLAIRWLYQLFRQCSMTMSALRVTPCLNAPPPVLASQQ